MTRITVKEYANLKNLGVTTVYRHIKAGKLKAEKEEDNTYVIINENQIKTDENQNGFQPVTNIETQQKMIDQLKSEVEHLRKHLNEQTTEKDHQMKELLKQQDQAQQIIAMQQKNLDRLTEQNQLLLEATQEKEEKKVGFWGRLIGQRA